MYGALESSERAIEAVGLSIRSASEFTKDNMAAFNEVVENSSRVEYYSFGSKQKELQLGELLRQNYFKITENLLERETDGLMNIEDVKWGKYLVTFEHDHLEVAGLNPRVNPRHVASLLVDNLRVHDVNFSDKKENARLSEEQMKCILEDLIDAQQSSDL